MSILDIIINLESSEHIVCTGSDLQIFSRTLFDKRLFDKRVTKLVGQPTWHGGLEDVKGLTLLILLFPPSRPWGIRFSRS